MDFFGGGCVRTVTHTESFLGHVAEHTLRTGFTTRKQCQESLSGSPTSQDAMITLYPTTETTAALKREGWAVSEDAKSMAVSAQELVISRLGEKDELSDFEHNLLVLAKTTAFEDKNAGICAYIIGWYLRETERDAQEKVPFLDEHFGEVKVRYGKKVPVKLTWLGCASFDGMYGTTFIHRFVDEDGRRLTWKTADGMGGVEAGDQVSGSFSVKEHGSWKGKKQTAITRCKWVD